MSTIARSDYHAAVGPTVGDMIRLADSDLFAEVEHDHTVYGDELTVGAGKNLRDGEALNVVGSYANGALDAVVQNVVVIDAALGIVKGDIGIRDGRIVAVGKGGNPDLMDGVTPGMTCGPNTTFIPGNGCFATAGAIEGHSHFISPQQAEHALAGGCTTMIGGSPGPGFDPSMAGPNTMAAMIRAADEYCINFGFLGRGASDPGAVEETVAGGAIGVKIHEDLGASPAVIEGSMTAAERHDFPVHIHTDTINEFGYCEETIRAIDGRVAHMYHVEGAGGGHSPDLLKVCSQPYVIPSSTNPTNPFTLYALEEGVPMTMLAHMMNYNVPADLAFAEARVRPQSMVAEDFLHDMGAISLMTTDSQGMGRLAENVAKSWQLAHVMKQRVGRLPEETTASADNERIKRYVAKTTSNPAIAVGIADHVGTLQPGRLADIVLWPFESFGVKPKMVLKAGVIAWASMGDGNASTMLGQPMVQRPSWGAIGSAKKTLGVTFVSSLAMENDVASRVGAAKEFLQITSIRKLTKQQLLHNTAMPHIEVDPKTFEVRADGRLLQAGPADDVPFNRKYLLR